MESLSARQRKGHVVEVIAAKDFPPGWGVPATASALNWSLLPAGLLGCATQAMLDAGVHPTWGVTKDHTAVTLTLWTKGVRGETKFIGTLERLAVTLNELIDFYGSQAEDIRTLFGLDSPSA